MSTKIENPMAMDEVRKLKPIKAKTSENLSGAEEFINKKPEMITINGLRFPKGTETVGVPLKGITENNELKETDHFYPTHSDFEFIAKLEPKNNRKPKFIERDSFMSNGGAKTIFGPDQRKVYYSTAYPWRC